MHWSRPYFTAKTKFAWISEKSVGAHRRPTVKRLKYTKRFQAAQLCVSHYFTLFIPLFFCSSVDRQFSLKSHLFSLYNRRWKPRLFLRSCYFRASARLSRQMVRELKNIHFAAKRIDFSIYFFHPLINWTLHQLENGWWHKTTSRVWWFKWTSRWTSLTQHQVIERTINYEAIC